MPASSDMGMGIEARIQKLPSSSAGRNSDPRKLIRPPINTRKPQPNATTSLRRDSAQLSAGEYTLRRPRTTMVSTSPILSGIASDASTGVMVKVAINAPASA